MVEAFLPGWGKAQQVEVLQFCKAIQVLVLIACKVLFLIICKTSVLDDMASGTSAVQCCGSGGTEQAKHSVDSLFALAHNLDDLCSRSDKWSPSVVT